MVVTQVIRYNLTNFFLPFLGDFIGPAPRVEDASLLDGDGSIVQDSQRKRVAILQVRSLLVARVNHFDVTNVTWLNHECRF